jgi:UDPglucose--hexose-1-phosphate uridylyltransferase
VTVPAPSRFSENRDRTAGHFPELSAVYPYQQAIGPRSRQELIIESPRHVESYSQLTAEELVAAFWVYRQRLQAYQQCPGLKYVLLFKNCRPEAGASLAHIHSQLFGLDFVPAAVVGRERRLSRPAATPGIESASHSDARGPASALKLLQQVAHFEQQEQCRVVERAEHWLAFCPFASRFAYQTWIVPQHHWGPYWDQSDTALSELAGLIQRWVSALERLLDKPAYNVIYHNPLVRSNRAGGEPGHAYVELFARIGNVAGFEWGSNCWINTISPETAARQLRETISEGSATNALGDTQLQRHSGG